VVKKKPPGRSGTAWHGDAAAGNLWRKREVNIMIHRNDTGGRIFVALLLIGVGTIFLLDSLDFMPARYLFSTFWPLLLVFVGIKWVVRTKRPHFVGGAAMIVAGVLFQLMRLDVLSGNLWGFLWPAMFILVGICVLFKPGREFHHQSSGEPQAVPSGEPQAVPPGEPPALSQDDIDVSVVFSGVTRRITSQQFQGAKVSAVFGGAVIDLTTAEIEGEEATVRLSTVFGNIRVIVPFNWEVVVQGQPVLARISDRHRSPPRGESTATLHVKAEAVFASVLIENQFDG